MDRVAGSGEAAKLQDGRRFSDLSLLQGIEAGSGVVDPTRHHPGVAVGIELLGHADLGARFPVPVSDALLVFDGRPQSRQLGLFVAIAAFPPRHGLGTLGQVGTVGAGEAGHSYA